LDPYRNPYTPGAGVKPPALAGRDDLIRKTDILLGRLLEGRPGQSLLTTGLRGVGKTVLLNRFVEIAASKKYTTAYIECTEQGGLPLKLATRLRAVLFELDRMGGISEKVRQAMAVLTSFAWRVNPDGSQSFTMGVDARRGSADSGELSEDLTDLFVAVGEAARDRRAGVLIGLDELQYLTSDELGAVIMALHRAIQLALPIVVIGTGLPQIAALAGEAKSYSERLFEFTPVGSLSPADARDAIERPAEALGVAFSSEALDAIVTATHGYPYFIQEWAAEAWNHADPRGNVITKDDVEAVRPIVQEKLDNSFFRVRVDRLTPAEREYVFALAALGPGSHRSGEVATRMGRTVESVAPTRQNLQRKGMVYGVGRGETAFTVPLFDEYVRRTMEEPAAHRRRRR
jgi:AAA ATPase domain